MPFMQCVLSCKNGHMCFYTLPFKSLWYILKCKFIPEMPIFALLQSSVSHADMLYVTAVLLNIFAYTVYAYKL